MHVDGLLRSIVYASVTMTFTIRCTPMSRVRRYMVLREMPNSGTGVSAEGPH